jgi:hypothetical protein
MITKIEELKMMLFNKVYLLYNLLETKKNNIQKAHKIKIDYLDLKKFKNQ